MSNKQHFIVEFLTMLAAVLGIVWVFLLVAPVEWHTAGSMVLGGLIGIIWPTVYRRITGYDGRI